MAAIQAIANEMRRIHKKLGKIKSKFEPLRIEFENAQDTLKNDVEEVVMHA